MVVLVISEVVDVVELVVVVVLGSTGTVVLSGTDVVVVLVVVVVVAPDGVIPLTTIGVVEPGLGVHPGGGFVWDGTGPAVGTTWGEAGLVAEGG